MKRISILAIAVSALGLSVLNGAPALAQDIPNRFAGIDRDFVCPESLPSDAARFKALGDYMAAVRAAAPDESIAGAIDFRHRLLDKHGCTATLAHMQQHDAAVQAGNVLGQDWLPLETGGEAHLSVSVTSARLFADPRYPGGHSVEVYTRLDMPQPAQTSATHVTYDTVVSHTVYYCRAKAYALIENDYFLTGKPVLKDPSPPKQVGGVNVYDLTATPPGSLNATAQDWACNAIQGNSA